MPTPVLPTAADYLAEANRREALVLEAFFRQGELIRAMAQLVHCLQRERGISSLYLASQSQAQASLRTELVGQTDAAIEQLQAVMPTQPRDLPPEISYRLLKQFARALQDLAPLAAVRDKIGRFEIGANGVLHFYSGLVRSLLQVVFESTEMMAEPALAHALIALFNIMQCKELAGQERATGATAFGGGGFSTPLHNSWQALVDAQEQCLQIFDEFADEAARQIKQEIHQLPFNAEFERLRRRALTSPPGKVLDAVAVGPQWFASSSERIDALRTLEDHLVQTLQDACQQRLQEVQGISNEAMLAALEPWDEGCFVVLYSPSGGEGHGMPRPEPETLHYRHDAINPRVGRMIIDLLYQRSRQLQQTEQELSSTRNALEERKLISRAKAVLMKQRRIDEEQAHKLLQNVAMNQRKSLAEVSLLLLALEQG